METKLVKYGLGVFAPIPKTLTTVRKVGTVEIEAGRDAGEMRLDFAQGVTDYAVTMRERSRATFVIEPPTNRPVTVSVTLTGVGASYEAKSSFRADGNEVIDLRHEVVHAAPHTTSNLKVRGVLGGSAKAFARGLVRIPKGMPGCVGRQKEEIILLSDKAEVAAMPDLEIASHEVQCGHAATIGRIDPEKLHYFETRGITRAEATEIIVEGFLSELSS